MRSSRPVELMEGRDSFHGTAGLSRITMAQKGCRWGKGSQTQASGEALAFARDRISHPRDWDSSLGPSAPSNKGFAQYQSHLPSASACLQSQTPIISSNVALRRLHQTGFQWQLLMLQDTLGFPSDLDFLRHCCSLLSGSEDPGLRTPNTLQVSLK